MHYIVDKCVSFGRFHFYICGMDNIGLFGHGNQCADNCKNGIIRLSLELYTWNNKDHITQKPAQYVNALRKMDDTSTFNVVSREGWLMFCVFYPFVADSSARRSAVWYDQKRIRRSPECRGTPRPVASLWKIRINFRITKERQHPVWRKVRILFFVMSSCKEILCIPSPYSIETFGAQAFYINSSRSPFQITNSQHWHAFWSLRGLLQKRFLWCNVFYFIKSENSVVRILRNCTLASNVILFSRKIIFLLFF